MISPRRDPYLWIHLAGLATVPLWLDVCLAGLAVGDPVVPPWLELTTLVLVGTAPILWMQLRRPFYIFSVLVLAVRPDKLSEQRRQLLPIQRGWQSRVLVVAGAIALIGLLVWLYRLAPIAASMTPFAAQTRTVGWLICAIAFLFANLFVQVPMTVIPLLLASPKSLEATDAYEPEAVLQKFTVMGIRVSSILPDWVGPVPDPAISAPSSEISKTPISAEVLPESEGVEGMVDGTEPAAVAIAVSDDLPNQNVDETADQNADKTTGVAVDESDPVIGVNEPDAMESTDGGAIAAEADDAPDLVDSTEAIETEATEKDDFEKAEVDDSASPAATSGDDTATDRA